MKNAAKLLLLCSLCSLATAACAQDTQPASASAPPETGLPVQTEGEQAAAESLMDKPLDGTSPEAFEAGLEAIKTEVGANEYSSVQSALKSMLFYNMAYRGKKEKLYAAMNGKTPNEIIEMAER